jgi:hypothetical protein
VTAAIAIAIDRGAQEHRRDQDRDDRENDCREKVNDTHKGRILSSRTRVRRADFLYDSATSIAGRLSSRKKTSRPRRQKLSPAKMAQRTR